MMEELEGTTVELIHRRRLRSFHLGYAMVLMVSGLLVSLPLVRTDVVCSTGGMLRPVSEPRGIFAPMSGEILYCRMEEGRQVSRGDTLLLFRMENMELKKSRLTGMLELNRLAMDDIHFLLRDPGLAEDRDLPETRKYLQELRKYREEMNILNIEAQYLKEEFRAAEKLFKQQVIPAMEYEKSRTAYHSILSRMEVKKEVFRNNLEEELFRLENEGRDIESDIGEIEASIRSMMILSPVNGILHKCAGISAGSHVGAGIRLATLVPEGPLVAECHVNSRDIASVYKGMPVKLRFQRSGYDREPWHRLRVDGIEPDAILVDGCPVYRVRCLIDQDQPGWDHLIPGMTFTANLVLYRSSLGKLVLRRMEESIRPAHAG